MHDPAVGLDSNFAQLIATYAPSFIEIGLKSMNGRTDGPDIWIRLLGHYSGEVVT